MNKIILIGAAALLIIAILAGGAYTATQLLTGTEETAARSGGGARVMQSVSVSNNGDPQSVIMTILPSPDLPNEEATVSGIVLSREDDTLIVGTGSIELSVDIEVNGETGQETVNVVPSTSGPEIEVVITGDTAIYRDVTDIAGSRPAASGEVTITQEVKPVAAADEIAADMELQAWGEKRGDRVIAHTVVFGPLAGGQFDN